MPEFTYSEVIGEMIHDAKSFRDFLKASPGESYSFSSKKEEFEQEYYRFLHSDSSEAQNLLSDIGKAVKKQDAQTFIIHGYKGCGKTTLSHYLSRNLPYRTSVLTFDLTLDTKLFVRNQLIRKIYNDILDDIDNEYKTIKEMLSIFYFNKNNAAFLDRRFDTSNTYFNFFKLLDQINNNTNNKDLEIGKAQIKDQLNSAFTIEGLFTFIVIWDIAYRIIKEEKPKYILILDNLDVLIQYEPLRILFNEYAAFCHNCRFLFDNISSNNLTKAGYNPFQDYTFIFVMRETTKATIIEHFSDRYPNTQGYIPYEVSSIFSKLEILKKRLLYIERNPYVCTEIKHIANELNRLLNDKHFKDNFFSLSSINIDKYSKNNFFSLFNDDYRTGIDALCEILEVKGSFVDEYIHIKNCYPHNTTTGSQGLFIRYLCDLLYEKGYLREFLFTEYTKDKTKSDPLSINISRLILTYLKNRCTLYSPKGKKRDDESVSLLDIFEQFKDVCELNEVNKAICFMFDLRMKPYWNHLITFQKIDTLDYSDLQNQLLSFNSPSRINSNNFCTLIITPAGRFFLDNILVHFEYYSCRFQSNNSESPRALFDNKNSIFTEGHFAFEKIIQNTINLVKECCRRLSNYYKTVFQQGAGYKDDEFLFSPFAYHKLDDEGAVVNHMFHAERMIHSHIDYLDVYRRYVINKIKDKNLKIDANKKMIEYIKTYMDMFGFYSKVTITHYSEQTNTLCNYYNNCINKIKKDSYIDFTTAIDRKTGRRLEI